MIDYNETKILARKIYIITVSRSIRFIRRLYLKTKRIWFEKKAKKLLLSLDINNKFSILKKFEYLDRSGKVLFLAHMSLPYDGAGYATRSHSILRNLKKNRVEVYSRLGYPFDLKKSFEKYESIHGIRSNIVKNYIYDGVNYNKLLCDSFGQNTLDRYKYIIEYSKSITDLVEKNKYSVIHANSDYRNGVAAAIASIQSGTPLIYEIRGLWHVTRASKESSYKNNEDYNLCEKLELQACNQASTIIALTSGIKNWLVERGVDSCKIEVVPNGVDINCFTNPTKTIFDKTNKKLCVGYIGSFVKYEGLELIVEAAKILKEKGYKFEVLLVGDGETYSQINKKVSYFGLENEITLTGRVPFSQVDDLYNKIDILVYPRLPVEVCELVSPLKPFEAMYKSKAIIASDVDAQKEFIEDGVNGILHIKGNVNSIVEKLELLLNSSELRNSLGVNAHNWVISNRKWPDMAIRIEDIHKKYI